MLDAPVPVHAPVEEMAMPDLIIDAVVEVARLETLMPAKEAVFAVEHAAPAAVRPTCAAAPGSAPMPTIPVCLIRINSVTAAALMWLRPLMVRSPISLSAVPAPPSVITLAICHASAAVRLDTVVLKEIFLVAAWTVFSVVNIGGPSRR